MPKIFNDCHCCAERKALGRFQAAARREGVQPARMAHWIHRKYGDLVVKRVLHNGEFGTSFPCVICRKALERHAVQWKAHIGPVWIKSTDPCLPRSRPTNKQVLKMGFRKLLP